MTRGWACPACYLKVEGRVCPHCHTRKATKRSSLRTRADALWSSIIRSQGRCLRCGIQSALQAAHIIGRARLSVRWNLDNGLCLCARCHRLFDSYAIDRDELILKGIGAERYSALKREAMKVWDKDYGVVIERLNRAEEI